MTVSPVYIPWHEENTKQGKENNNTEIKKKGDKLKKSQNSQQRLNVGSNAKQTHSGFPIK